MSPAQNCSVGILRPTEAATSRLFQHEVDAIEGDQDVSEAMWSYQIAHAVESIRDMIVEAAKELAIQVGITEYQLHKSNGSFTVMGRKRSRNVQEHEILISFNPSPAELAFVSGIREHPLRRSVVSFTSADTLLDMSRLMGANQIPLADSIGSEQVRVIHRIFALVISPNEEQADEHFKDNKGVVAQALAYPEIDPLLVNRRNLFGIQMLEDGERETKPEFREYLVEPETDKRGKEN